MSGLVFGISKVQSFDDPGNPTVFGIEKDSSGRTRISTGDGSGRTGSDAPGHTPSADAVDEQR